MAWRTSCFAKQSRRCCGGSEVGPTDARLEMSAEELHLLRDLFQQASGFLLREDLKFIAERRLASRLELLGLRNFLAYARYLRFDARGPCSSMFGRSSLGRERSAKAAACRRSGRTLASGSPAAI